MVKRYLKLDKHGAVDWFRIPDTASEMPKDGGFRVDLNAEPGSKGPQGRCKLSLLEVAQRVVRRVGFQEAVPDSPQVALQCLHFRLIRASGLLGAIVCRSLCFSRSLLPRTGIIPGAQFLAIFRPVILSNLPTLLSQRNNARL